ncbi:MAG: hypothetical protein COB30_017205 [Ectothiorhodospiraceae bacterium]|nr:hypothetical protein [Ectothiorhodospiraceae bacterium]
MSSDALFISANIDDFSEARVQWHNDWKINQQSSLQFGVELRQIEGPDGIAKNNFNLGDFANGVTPIRYTGNCYQPP